MVNSYRKKPVVIQAEQYIAERDRLPFSDEGDPVEYDEDEHRPYILSLEGKHWVSDGDWIIRGVKGEFYACKPDIFALTYEAADLRPEGSVVLPAELVRKILEQHELAADALVDSHGDIHREIVAELQSRVPQAQIIKENP